MGRRNRAAGQEGSRRSRLDVFSTGSSANRDSAPDPVAEADEAPPDPVAAAVAAKALRREEELRAAAKAAAAAAAANVSTWVEGDGAARSSGGEGREPDEEDANPLAALIGYGAPDGDEDEDASPSQSPRANGGAGEQERGRSLEGADIDGKVADFLGELESDGLLSDQEAAGGGGADAPTSLPSAGEPGPQPGEEGLQPGEQRVLEPIEGQPEGWSRVLDADSGNVYFWNEETDEVLWELPCNAEGGAPAKPQQQPGDAEAAPPKAEGGTDKGAPCGGWATPEAALAALAGLRQQVETALSVDGPWREWPERSIKDTAAALQELETAAASARRLLLISAPGEQAQQAEGSPEEGEAPTVPGTAEGEQEDEDMEIDDGGGPGEVPPPGGAALPPQPASSGTAALLAGEALLQHPDHYTAYYAAYYSHWAAAGPAGECPPLPMEPPPLPPDEDGAPVPPPSLCAHAPAEPQPSSEAAAELLKSSIAAASSSAAPAVITAAPALRIPAKDGERAPVKISSGAKRKAGSTARKLPKAANAMLSKWQKVREEEREAAAAEAAVESELFDAAAINKKRMREAEEWRRQQLVTGEAAENANFQPLAGDWREKVKRAQQAAKKEASGSAAAAAPRQQKRPDLVEASRGLPQGWQAMWDKASGELYYGNLSTGETTWDRPC